MTFGEWIQAQRQARGWSLQRLADEMLATGHTTKASAPYIQQLERGEINPDKMGGDKVRALAAALGVSAEDLLAAALGVEIASVNPDAYLSALASLGVPQDTLRELAALAHYLTRDDWEGFLDTARRRQRQKQRAAEHREQRDRQRGGHQRPTIGPDDPPGEPPGRPAYFAAGTVNSS